MKPCYTKATKLVLLDGREYTFRALPFNEATLALTDEVRGERSAEALLRAIRISLSFDQSPEDIEEALGSGAIPFPEVPLSELHQAIVKAMEL